MTKLDDFFSTSRDTLGHPRLRNWKQRLDSGAQATLELYRPDTALGLAQRK